MSAYEGLSRNTLAQATPMIAGYLFSFLSGPIVVASLGLRAFGIWALTGALGQYAGVLDLGVGRSLSRFVALHEDDETLVGEFVVTALVMVCVVGGAMAIAAVALASVLAESLGGMSSGDMRVILLSSAVLLVTSMLNRWLTAYAVGRREMVYANVGLTVATLLNFVFSVGALVLGADLLGYAEANAVAGLVSVPVVALVTVATDMVPPVTRPSRGTVRDLIGYSVRAQTVWISDLVNYQTDKVVIALAVGPATAGAYELANRVASAARQVGVYTVSALVPAMTNAFRAAGIASVRGPAVRMTQRAATLGFPPLVFTGAAAPLLLHAWLGRVPKDATIVLVGLTAAYVVNVSTGVSYTVAASIGRPGTPARSSVLTAVANLILTVALAPLFGIWGVLAGTIVAISGGSLLQVALVHRMIEIPFRSYIESVRPSMVASLTLAVPVAAISASQLFSSRVLSGIAVAVAGLLYAWTYFCWALWSSALPTSVDRRLGQLTPWRWIVRKRHVAATSTFGMTAEA